MNTVPRVFHQKGANLSSQDNLSTVEPTNLPAVSPFQSLMPRYEPLQISREELAQLQAEQHKDRGNDLYLLSHYEQAIAEYLQAIYSSPSYTDPYYNLGKIYIQLGDHPRAIEALRRLLVIAPDDYEARTMLAGELSSNEQPQQAIEQYQVVLQQQPHYDTARRKVRYLQGQLAYKQQPIAAQEAYTQQATHTLKASKQLLQQYYEARENHVALQLLDELDFQFAATQSKDESSNLAEFDYTYRSDRQGQHHGLIRLRPELAYADPIVVSSYLIHEMVHAQDQDAISSIMEEQDAYREQTRFWKEHRGPLRDSNLDLALEYYHISIDKLDQEVRRNYQGDHLLPEKSPGHGLTRSPEDLKEYQEALSLVKDKQTKLHRLRLLVSPV